MLPKKILPGIWRLLAIVFVIILLVLGGFLLHAHIYDFSPPSKEKITAEGSSQKRQIAAESIRLISWNIGYGGLGKAMDFFYDGGKKMRATKEQSSEWLHQISRWIVQNNQADFFLLQEVDFHAKRTYFKDQSLHLAQLLPDYEMIKAVNYKIPFVPLPISEPMGKVEAGMLTFSAYKSIENTRFAYPQIAGWPERMFLLDRCFIKISVATSQGNELVIFNTHNSAFIDDPKKMQYELQTIRDEMLMEYQLGNFVVAGGDWNMNPPTIQNLNYLSEHHFVASAVQFPSGFFPDDWQIAFDPKAPTNRQLYEAYQKGITGSTTIDYFIVSPNLLVESIATIDLNFEMSDHHPVMIEVNLKPPIE